jgi:hypothetical protein
MKHKYFSLIFVYIPLGLSKRLFYHEGSPQRLLSALLIVDWWKEQAFGPGQASDFKKAILGVVSPVNSG